MRFEIVDRQRFKHAVLVAHFIFAIPASADVLLVIGHPTGHNWRVPKLTAVSTKIVDADAEPRLAEAYSTFARIVGVEGDPLFVLTTGFMEPFAASTEPAFVESALKDRQRLIDEAGLAVRRYLLNGTVAATPKMSRPYDYVGGGFFRCDRCYDKTLADQAAQALLGLDEWEKSHNPHSEEIVRGTLDFALDDLQEKSGVFAAGANADSLVARGSGPAIVEGAYYLWTTEEIHRVLGSKRGDAFIAYYGDTLPVPVNPNAPLTDDLRASRNQLLEVRLKRPKPPWHERVIISQNARMIDALARAAVAFNEPRYAREATRAARALVTKTLTSEESALLETALLDLYRATLDLTIFEKAMTLPAGSRVVLPEAVAALAPGVPIAAPSFDSLKKVLIAGPAPTLFLAALPKTRDHLAFVVNTKRARTTLAKWMPYVSDFVADPKETVATVCDQQGCRTPTNDPAKIAAWLQ